MPIWAWVLAAVLAWGAWQRHSATRAQQALAAQQVQAEADRAQAMHAALIETQRRLTAQKGITDAARQRTAAALADRAAAASAADSLREQAQQLAARSGACDPAASGGGEADRLADVLAQSVERYREVAAAADRAIVSGHACEQSYSALTK